MKPVGTHCAVPACSFIAVKSEKVGAVGLSEAKWGLTIIYSVDLCHDHTASSIPYNTTVDVNSKLQIRRI